MGILLTDKEHRDLHKVMVEPTDISWVKSKDEDGKCVKLWYLSETKKQGEQERK